MKVTENNMGLAKVGTNPPHFRSLKRSLFRIQNHTYPLVGVIP